MNTNSMFKLTTREIILAGLFTAITIVGAKVNFMLPVIPITLQPLIVVLAGCLLGRKAAFLSQFVYVLLGLVGIPVFSKAVAGPGYALQPSFGYLLGFMSAAYVIGWMIEKLPARNIFSFLSASFIGTIIIYLFGLTYFYLLLNFVLAKPMSVWDTFIKTGFFITIPKDLAGACIIAGLAASVYKKVNLGLAPR